MRETASPLNPHPRSRAPWLAGRLVLCGWSMASNSRSILCKNLDQGGRTPVGRVAHTPLSVRPGTQEGMELTRLIIKYGRRRATSPWRRRRNLEVGCCLQLEAKELSPGRRLFSSLGKFKYDVRGDTVGAKQAQYTVALSCLSLRQARGKNDGSSNLGLFKLSVRPWHFLYVPYSS